ARRRPPPPSTLFPYTTLFRSRGQRLALERLLGRRRAHGNRRHRGQRDAHLRADAVRERNLRGDADDGDVELAPRGMTKVGAAARSEEHTSELQSRFDLVCRLL